MPGAGADKGISGWGRRGRARPPTVTFPEPVVATEDVLIESFEPGLSILNFVDDPETPCGQDTRYELGSYYACVLV